MESNRIMELAAELGKCIKSDARVKRYDEANKAYDESEELQKLIAEYNTQRAALDEENKKEAPDAAFTEVIEARIESLYNDIMFNPVYAEYSDAKDGVDELMQQAYGEITFQITGERPCSHDHCSSCSGCH